MKVLFILLGIAALLLVGYKALLKIRQKFNYLTTISNLVEHSRDISYYCELKPEFKYRFLSPAVNCILGPNVIEESMHNPYTAFERIHPDDLPVLLKKVSGELEYDTPIIQRWRNDAGKYIWFEEYATPIYKNGDIVAIQGIIRNISDKVELQKQLEYKVSHDSLTNVFNRGYFESMIQQYDNKIDAALAIVIIDLDDLKAINDRYGHKLGDELIKETAGILNSFSDSNVIVSRLGGDEFAILLVESHPGQAEAFVAAVQQEIGCLNRKGTRLFGINLSIGWAFTPSSLGRMEELFIEADDLMYRDKKLNKNQRRANSAASVK